MPTAKLDITLVSTRDAAQQEGFIMLEQEAWDPYAGKLTKMQALSWIGLIMFKWTEPAENCFPAGPGWGKYLYAYPYPADLHFRVGVSHGGIVGGYQETREFSELLQCNLELSPSLKYPPFKIASYAWEGDCYNAKGETVQAPRITLVRDIIRLSAKVFGTLRVEYIVVRYVYPFTVQPREEYHETKYQSFFWAVWDGGTKYLEIESPFGAETENEECLNKWAAGIGHFPGLPTPGGTSFNSPDGNFNAEDKPYGPVSGSDEYVDIDYCTQTET